MNLLEQHQRAVLALIKSRATDCAGDPWITRVSGSRELEMVRGIALWWRQYQIEAQCLYTTRALKGAGRFEQTVSGFFDGRATSPFIEELGRAFLGALRADADPVVRAVAMFESACHAVREGSLETFRIEWDRDPTQVLRALETRTRLPKPGRGCVMLLGKQVPGLIALEPRVFPSVAVA